MRLLFRSLVVFASLLLLGSLQRAEAAHPSQPAAYQILLRSRQFVPARGIEAAARTRLQSRVGAHHMLLQLNAIPDLSEQQWLAANGVRLLNYLPDHAWFAVVDADSLAPLEANGNVRWLGAIAVADKLPARLLAGKPLAHALDADGTVSLRVAYFDDVSESAALDALMRHAGVVGLREPLLHSLMVRLPLAQVRALAAEDAIRWLAESPPPPTPMNDAIRSRIRVNAVQAAPYNLNGSGVRIGQWDCGPVGPHVDFAGRLTNIAGQTDDCSPSAQHSTHVAGIMASSGANSLAQGGTANQWRGMAPGAQIIAYDFYTATAEVQSAIGAYNIDLSQNSWGFIPSQSEDCNAVYGNYNNLAPAYDQIVMGVYGKRIPVAFAAGNSQGACGMWSAITPPGTAKNVITVGATNALNDAMTAFSSWGPTDDGRIKPDVVAPGYRDDIPGNSGCSTVYFTGIKSTCPNDGYGMIYGTSMATPAVSGMLALMLQQYRISAGQPLTNPLPSTLKALAIHGAVDLGNVGPDYKFGWGRVDAKNSVDLIRRAKYKENTVSDGQVVTYTANVLSCDTSLKATLVWDDPAAADNALVAYINDLDLTLVDPTGNTNYPWLLDPFAPNNAATRGVDFRNNVEQAQVTNPVAGAWTIRVRGNNVPQAPQRFSLVSESLNTPTLNAIAPTQTQPGAQLVLRGAQFELGCSASSLVVNFGGGATALVSPGNFTNDTITVTVPSNADSGNVSVTTPAGTTNALYLSITRPRVYLPIVLNNYPPPFGWIDASDGARIANGDEELSVVSLPFPFKFYGSTYVSVTVSSNGFLSFDPLADASPAASCVPTTTLPNNAVYGYWVDLDPSAGGAVWFKSLGNAAVIEWQNVPRWTQPNIETFEIVLRLDNSIAIQYQAVDNLNDVSVGIENANGDVGITSYCNHSNPPAFELGTRPAAGQLFFYTTP
ncbi:MAG: S8 family serine peptidase [Chloroflexota bacterium]